MAEPFVGDGVPENPVRQANIAIVEYLQKDLFNPTEPEDVAWFNDPSIKNITFTTTHKQSGDEMHIGYYKDDPYNTENYPPPEGISLPAIQVDIKIEDQKSHVTSSGIVTGVSATTSGEVYFTDTIYWFDFKGNAARVTTTQLIEGEDAEETDYREEDEALAEKKEVTPLDPGDYELVESKLAQLKNDEFEEGEYSGDRPRLEPAT